MVTRRFISTAEAAFVAGLTVRQVSRVLDEHLVPEAHFEQQGGQRRFTVLGAALARFYFGTERLLVAGARRRVIEELSARVGRAQPSWTEGMDLSRPLLRDVSWTVEIEAVAVDVLPYVQATLSRAEAVIRAHELVVTDRQILSGLPVFAGTRVPVEIVLASLAKGVEMDCLQKSYPFLTEALVQAAKVYVEVHPRRGRQPRLSDVLPAATRRSVRVVLRGTNS